MRIAEDAFPACRSLKVDLQAHAKDPGLAVAVHVFAAMLFDLCDYRVNDVLRVQGQVHGRGQGDVVERLDDMLKRFDIDTPPAEEGCTCQVVRLLAPVVGNVGARPAKTLEIVVATGDQHAPAADTKAVKLVDHVAVVGGP